MKLGAFRRPSLARRRVFLAAGWSLAGRVISAVVLAMLFQQAALRTLDAGLSERIENLLAGTTIGPEGEVLAPALTDERAVRAYSGRYWQIAEPTPDGRWRALVRSRSLWDSELTAPADLVIRLSTAPGRRVTYDARDPLGAPLRAMAYQAQIPGRPAPVIFMTAEDRTPIDRDVRSFAFATTVFFLLLALTMAVAVVLQVRVGLRPLFSLRREIADVRQGKADRLQEAYPVELEPLADELNALMAHNQEVVERQRTHVGNLAHALKTPLSVIHTEAQQQPGPLAEVVVRQADVMRQQVDHHLRRARAAARNQGLGERTSVASVLDELARALGRVHEDKEIDWDAEEDLFFLGERQDLQEIAGNAIENACKWGRRRVRVRAEPIADNALCITIEDDGPGLPPDRREQVLRRGARLDESAPGSGLGLSIVEELARAYGGSVRLGDAALGGLLVELQLPRAQA